LVLAVDGAITWRPVTVADFPLLRTWLAQPYVDRWWNHVPGGQVFGVARTDVPPTFRRPRRVGVTTSTPGPPVVTA
jgi:hypothetical protein